MFLSKLVANSYNVSNVTYSRNYGSIHFLANKKLKAFENRRLRISEHKRNRRMSKIT